MTQLLQLSRWNMRRGCKAETWLYPRFEDFNMTMFLDRSSWVRRHYCSKSFLKYGEDDSE
jgi:hypothetical protein